MEHYVVNKFNRGEVSANALARDDYQRVVNSAAHVENFIPLRLGPMQYRPGTTYLGDVAGESYLVPFICPDLCDGAVLEFSNNLLRVWIGDALVTRTSVTSTITNGDFASDPLSSGWTDASGAGSAVTHDATNDYAILTGTGATSAAMYQTIASTDTGSEHAMRVIIHEAPATVYVGTSGSKSFDIFKGRLDPGVHSLVFTPASNITITIENELEYRTLIESVAFETTGTFTLPTDIATANLETIRFRQSADVMFVAWGTSAVYGAPFKIERRGVKSWSIADYLANDGPFKTINDTVITMTPGALTGNTTLTASQNFFEADHVGCLFKVASATQESTADITSADDGTGSVRVAGVGDARWYTVEVDFTTGSGVGTVTLQRSADDVTWTDITSWTSDVTDGRNDELDGAVFYYRLWVKTGDYTSGTITATISTSSAGIKDGICRVTGFTSATVVSVQVLRDFLSTDATRDWYEGEWSAVNGYPTSVALHEGRLCWAGRTRVWLSVSDSYYSFDDLIEGDSAAILRTVGYGPVEDITWMAETTRLLLGLGTDIAAIRSSSFGEILTPSNTNIKSSSTQGVAKTDCVLVDDLVYYAHRNNDRLMEIDYRIDKDTNYSFDRTILNEDICSAGIKRIAVQRVPETRVYVVLDDGEMRVLGMEPIEEVQSWARWTTDGTIEDVIAIPDNEEDRIYLVVNRTGGRYLERMAKYTEAQGSTVSKHFDSAVVYSSHGSSTYTGLDHLNGETVGVWGNGAYIGQETVASGQVVLGATYADAVIGLPYTAKYTSNKISGFVKGSVLSVLKRVVSSSLIMSYYQDRAVTVGYNATTGQGAMPLIENGSAVTQGAVANDYDEIPFEFDGDTETDPRVYIQSTGPCLILAMALKIDMGEGMPKL